MTHYHIPDMTCGHCAGTITKAIKALDPAATVDIDLPQHLVRVESRADAAAVEKAIREEGYTPTVAA